MCINTINEFTPCAIGVFTRTFQGILQTSLWARVFEMSIRNVGKILKLRLNTVRARKRRCAADARVRVQYNKTYYVCHRVRAHWNSTVDSSRSTIAFIKYYVSEINFIQKKKEITKLHGVRTLHANLVALGEPSAKGILYSYLHGH